MTTFARRRIRPRRSVIILIASTILAGLVALVVLVSSVPESFVAPNPAVRDVASERARIFEQRFISELTRIRGPEAEWGIRIRQDDLNAWLWVRLPQWMSHVGTPDALDLPPVQSTLGSERILVTSPGWAFAFEPFVSAGGLSLEPRSGGSLGRLPLPGRLLRYLGDTFDFELVLSSLGGLTPSGSALPCRFKLGDGRVVEILETRPGDGELVLLFRTEAPETSAGS